MLIDRKETQQIDDLLEQLLIKIRCSDIK